MKQLLVLCLAIPAFGQPAFTVASVKPAEFRKPTITLDPGRITLNSVTLKTLIGRAYSVKDYQVRGPEWISNTAYDVQATMPPDTPEATTWQMLQTLLKERFQVELRRATEEMSVYALVPGKNGPKLQAAAGGEPNVTFRGGAMQAKNTTVKSLVNLLGSMLDRPVVDQTGVSGGYDFTLAFTPDASIGPASKKMSIELDASKTETAGGSIFTAVQEQLGLKLEPRKAPVEVLTVEKALKVPVAN